VSIDFCIRARNGENVLLYGQERVFLIKLLFVLTIRDFYIQI
jgi:hypothetical protein